MSPVSKAGIQAREKYNSKTYEDLRIRVPKGRKAEIQAAADKAGQSLNGFVMAAINRYIEREKGDD